MVERMTIPEHRVRSLSADGETCGSSLPDLNSELRSGNGDTVRRWTTRPPPKVSIGLPVHNGEAYLKETIRSILCQDEPDFELIISDNASTDRTWEICQEIARQDPRVRLVRQAENRGAAWNFNRVFQMASGPYFKWAAHDDLLHPGYLSTCLRVLEEDRDAVLVYPRALKMGEAGEILGEYPDPLRASEGSPGGRLHTSLWTMHLPLAVFGVYRSQALERTPLIRPDLSSDRTLVLEMALHGRIRRIDEPLVAIRKVKSARAGRGISWWAPQNRERVDMRTWRLCGHVIDAVKRSPMPRHQKIALSLDAVLAFHIRNPRGVVYDITRVLLQVPRVVRQRLYEGRGRSSATTARSSRTPTGVPVRRDRNASRFQGDRATGYRILLTSIAVDETHVALANQVRWIRALAQNPKVESVTVLTQRHGPSRLPGNVNVRAFGAGPWRRRAIRLYAELWRLRRHAFDFIFVSMGGGPYPLLLWPVKLWRRVPLYQWKAHPSVDRLMGFYARYCNDLIFTSNPESFPLDLPNVVAVGQGIDTSLFAFNDVEPDRDLVVVGRVSKTKRLDLVIRAVARCRDLTGAVPRLDIVGHVDSKHHEYLTEIQELAQNLQVDDAVNFLGAVPYEALPALVGRYRAQVNFAETALDKSALEAMALGTPVVTTNPRVSAIYPRDLLSQLSPPLEDIDAQAHCLLGVLQLSAEERKSIGQRLRDVVLAGHDLDSLWGRIIGELERHYLNDPC